MLLAQKTNAPSKSNIDESLKNLAIFMYRVLYLPIYEFIYGMKARTLPLGLCMLWGTLVNSLVIARVDRWFFQYVDLDFLYPTGMALFIYKMIGAMSGFIAWSYFQVILRFRMLNQLTKVFTNAGLKSAMGNFPSFISDQPIDDYCRRLRLLKHGQTLQKFKEVKDHLQSGLKVFIEEMTEDIAKGTLDILYSHHELATSWDFKEIKDYPRDGFIVGKSRGPQIDCKLDKIPHLLVAGETGGGKSTFLRQFITGLYLKNSNYNFTLIDMKGGLEFQVFENLPRVEVFSNGPVVLSKLKNFTEVVLERRMALLKANNCKDLDEFNVLDSSKVQQVDGITVVGKLGREIIVVDEAFEIFMAGGAMDGKNAIEARRCATKIAAQGRAVGIHLVVATQRPDRFAVDPQTKANLTGVLSFRIGNTASSFTVLDSKRATDLPKIPGRAIWKAGSDTVEVQIPFLGKDELAQMLSHFKIIDHESVQVSTRIPKNNEGEPKWGKP